jgi:phosphatidylserine/phosphatidylglycerophosphate/cardiolipin synthase-like enzyme
LRRYKRGWDKKLNGLFQNVGNELVVSNPYISDIGAKFIIDNVSDSFKSNGVMKFITDLSPKNIYQGSTDPTSFRQLFKAIRSVAVFHLPRLHAKVYISDTVQAIITSANLTAGGIYNNFEYGIFVGEQKTVSDIKRDLLGYANLGASINAEVIDTYCDVSEELKEQYKRELFKRSSRINFVEHSVKPMMS